MKDCNTQSYKIFLKILSGLYLHSTKSMCKDKKYNQTWWQDAPVAGMTPLVAGRC